MNIKEFTDKLAANEMELSVALKRAKVLATRMKIDSFANWINFELNGYPTRNSLPEYRKLICMVEGDILTGIGIQKNIIVDVTVLNKQISVPIDRHDEFNGVESIEYTLKNLEGDVVAAPFPQPVVNSMPNTNPSHKLIAMRRIIAKNTLNNILIIVKNNLFDAILEIEKSYLQQAIEEKPLSESEARQINNYITYNIIGNNNNTNAIAGKEIYQR